MTDTFEYLDDYPELQQVISLDEWLDQYVVPNTTDGTQLSSQSARRWAGEGRIPCIKAGKVWIVSRRWADDHYQRKEQPDNETFTD